MKDETLIQRYLDGVLHPMELAALNQSLRDDAELREYLREMAEQAVALGDIARQLETGTGSRTILSKPDKAFIAPWLGLAASIVVLAASAWLWSARRQGPVLTLIDSSGSISWSQGGEWQSNVRAGQTLPAGTIETVGETATALLQFRDGTLLTLSGDSELSFSDESQKRLVLRKGALCAQVKPQPKDRPMLVRTPTAEAQVVGTVFNLAMRTDDTLLRVDEGLVKLKRLADNSSIDVSAKRSTVASLDSGIQLNSVETPEPLTDWSFHFATTLPPRDWRGFSKDGVMHASPHVAKRLPDGSVVTQYGISIRTAMLAEPLRIAATEYSVIRYRLRQERTGDLLLMLLTHRYDGWYGGNFECHIPSADLEPDEEGWCDLAIPVSQFRPVDPRLHVRQRHPTPAGNVITSAIIRTDHDDRKLAITHFAIQSQP